MKLLEERIAREGVIKDGDVLKVDMFLNHQMDIRLFRQMAEEWQRLYAGEEINKILTIEASGIGMACLVGEVMDVPVLFAKKVQTLNIASDVYTSKVFSYTHKTEYVIRVSKQFLGPQDKVLIIDDFLANGAALTGLIDIVGQSGATLVGCGVAVEKAYQPGGRMIREKGIRVESLARIAAMDEASGITFTD